MTPNKILFISNSAKIGGGSSSLLSLCEALNDLGASIHVFVPEEGLLSELLDAKKIQYTIQHTHLHLFSKTRKIIELIKIYIFLIKFKPEIVHFNDSYCYKYISRVVKLLGIPLVCHIRYFTTKEKLQFRIGNVYPDHLIFNSQYNLDATIENMDHSMKKNIPCAVAYNFFKDVDYYKPYKRLHARNTYNLNDNDIAISLVGNINPLKGHAVFLQAVNLALKNLNDEQKRKIKIFIVGSDVANSGEEKKCYELVDEKKLNSYVSFTGFVKDTAAIYAMTDILVIPSEMEPFGRVAVEGILAKKLIVASRTSGLNEILNSLKTPVLCQPSDPIELAKALKQAISDGMSNNDIEDDFHLIKNKFSVENQLKNLIRIYQASM